MIHAWLVTPHRLVMHLGVMPEARGIVPNIHDLTQLPKLRFRFLPVAQFPPQTQQVGPHDPRRAQVYQKVGIPTVATVRWTADQVLRRLMPTGMLSEWRDPSGNVVLAEIAYNPAWIGHRISRLEEQSGARVALLTRLGEGVLPKPAAVLQDGDLVHVSMLWSERDTVEQAFAAGPVESH